MTITLPPSAARAAAVAGVTALVMWAVSVAPGLGGYGAVLWAWHPALMTAGFVLCMPAGILVYKAAGLGTLAEKRNLHIALQCAGGVCVLLGYAVAYYVHAAKDKPHIPWERPDKTRLLHVLLGLAAIGGVVLQAASGAWRRYVGGSGALPASHSPLGVPVVLAALGAFALAALARYKDNHWSGLQLVLICGLLVAVGATLVQASPLKPLPWFGGGQRQQQRGGGGGGGGTAAARRAGPPAGAPGGSTSSSAIDDGVDDDADFEVPAPQAAATNRR